MTTETRKKLTERDVAALKPGSRDLALWDAALPGFGVRVKPSGVKSFVLWYRNRHGEKRLYTFGTTAAYRVEQAREEARKQLVRIKEEGADPLVERREARSGETVADLCARYLAEHAEPHKKPSAVKSDKRLIAANIKPVLGNRRIAGITSADVAKLHHAKRETPYEANRTLALLSKVFALAEVWKLRPAGSNPCRGIKRYKEATRERFYSPDELARLGNALAEAEHNGTAPAGAILAIKLLALTGCRVGEILSLKWEHVDLSAGLLRLADAKAGARNVPLGAPAIALLSDLPRDGSPWVVAGMGAGEPLSVWTLESAWQRLRKRAGLTDARLHDLRHTTGTYAGAAGLNAFIVRDLLGHKTLAMTGRYVERDTDPLRAAADHVSGRIAAAMAGKTAEVVPLVPTSATA